MSNVNKESYEIIKKTSSEDLRLEVARTLEDQDRIYLITKELEDRELLKQDENFKKMLDATKENAVATGNLVWVTGGLVVVTFLLVVVPILMGK